MTASSLLFYVNGERHLVRDVDPEMTLLRYLRDVLGLKGSKLGCGEGGCGACTVVIGRRLKGEIVHYAVNSCLMPICAVQLKHVITVEGLGSAKKAHPIQAAFANQHASQCGYCTPGFVMSLYARMRSGTINSDEELESCFDGNLCRCTGYRPIIDAARDLMCPMGADCCKNQKQDEVDLETDMVDGLAFCDDTQELIFPTELSLVQPDSLQIIFETCCWFAPTKLNEALHWYNEHPSAKIIFGNTEVGIEVKARHLRLFEILFLGDIEDLNSVTINDDQMTLGAGVCLKTMIDVFSRRREYDGLVEILKLFAGSQIRNVSTWVGNVVTASPISDLLPIFMVLNCTLQVQRSASERTISIHNFVTGYRKTCLKPGEIVTSISIPCLDEQSRLLVYKQSKRKYDDITIVNMAFKTTVVNEVITNVDVAVGGIASTTLFFKDCFQGTLGVCDKEVLANIIEAVLFDKISIDDSTPGGMAEYRKVLVASMIRQMLHDVTKNDMAMLEHSERLSKQVFSSQMDISSSKPHLSGLKHTTGEAVYTDDLPKFPKELYAGLVLSKVSHARLISVNAEKALTMPGVHSLITAKDIRGETRFGPIIKDEEVIVSEEINSTGQIIAIVLASDQVAAQRAANEVIVKYERLLPIMTMEEAIEKKSFFSITKQLITGVVEESFADSQFLIVEGTIKIHGQEHFYLETHAAIVVPGYEDDQITIYASTQNPSEAQEYVAAILDIPENRVVCKVTRLGGGFGGKESRSNFLLSALAVAVHKSGRPVRCQLDRDEDFQMTGQRHPFLADYKVAVTRDGMLKALDVKAYCNGGHSMDLSIGVLERALSHIDNCYHFPSTRIEGWVCRTNTPSNTAFRGFGGPQGMFICETIMDHISAITGLDPNRIRYQNLYQFSGQIAPFHMTMEDCSIRQIWDQLYRKTAFDSRRKQIDEFNKTSRWKKRGLSMIPTKFGIAFSAKHLNQAGCLVHLLKDGMVQMSHGGVEMGQGLHTKMTQIVASALKIPVENVYAMTTDTSHVANTSPSAASATSDLNGAALLNACDQLNERLVVVRRNLPDGTFKDIIQEAYRQRIDLTARGFYATPDVGFDWATGTGRLFNYFTYGVAVSEVEIDTLTGTSTTLSSSILMDLGTPINPAIDIGQIEGAFLQGIGLFTMEELWWNNKTKTMLTVGPGTYKIPTLHDCPKLFEVELYGENPNPRAVNSSRAVGEPPLFLAASVFFAIKEAIKAARENDEYFRLDSPATCARIRLSIEDDIVKKYAQQTSNLIATPWAFQI